MLIDKHGIKEVSCSKMLQTIVRKIKFNQSFVGPEGTWDLLDVFKRQEAEFQIKSSKVEIVMSENFA